MDFLVKRFRGSVSNQLQNRQPDINDQLRSLKESDVRVTFGDIWRDYLMYRKNFYYYQVSKPQKEVYAETQVKVDLDKFTVRGYFKWVMDNGQHLKVHEPGRIIYVLLFITGMMLASMVLTRPWKIYYDYKDPLLKDKDDTLVGISSEATMRRLKYKKKQLNW